MKYTIDSYFSFKGFRGDDCGFCPPGLSGDKGDGGERGMFSK